MAKRNFTPFPFLTTERLFLRDLQFADEEEILELRSNHEVNRYLDRGTENDREETRQFLKKIINGQSENKWITWAINLRGKNELIGTICLWNFSDEDNRGEVGYELHPDYQGQGIMQETLQAIISYAFSTLQLAGIEALTHYKNQGSINLLERNNFKRLSTLEEEFPEKKEMVSAYLYVLEP